MKVLYYNCINILATDQSIFITMDKATKVYRRAVDRVWLVYQKYYLQHARYYTIKTNTKYRHRRFNQILYSLIIGCLGGYFVANVLQIQNNQKIFHAQYFITQYWDLTKKVRGDKNDGQAYKVAYDLIKKGKQTQLTAIQLLALSQLVKKPQLNLHAQYIASLK